jgi:hypothetical protein
MIGNFEGALSSRPKRADIIIADRVEKARGGSKKKFAGRPGGTNAGCF